MKNSKLYLRKVFINSRNESFIPHKDNYLKSLRFIYCAENYCLRRIPAIVQLVRQNEIGQLLSDHVSVMMDRLNRLDFIFEIQKTKASGLSCSTFKGLINKIGNLIKAHPIRETKQQIELIDELIEISRYRYSIYQFLLEVATEQKQKTISNLLQQSLAEEDIFYQDLYRIRMQANPMDNLLSANAVEA